MKKDDKLIRYAVFRRVVLWEEWQIMAKNDKEATQILLDDDDIEFVEILSDDPVYLKPDDDGFVRFTDEGATTQLFRCAVRDDGSNYQVSKLVWDNTPISVVRNNKIEQLLNSKQ